VMQLQLHTKNSDGREIFQAIVFGKLLCIKHEFFKKNERL
jgi:hypothetical protein